MEENSIIALLITLAMIGILLLGNGITGLVVFGEDTKETCSSENLCTAPEVCCKFYEQEAGVCHTEDMCPRILEITKEQKLKEDELVNLLYPEEEKQIQNKAQKPIDEEDLQLNYLTQLIFGIMIVMITIFAIVFYIKVHLKHGHKKSAS